MQLRMTVADALWFAFLGADSPSGISPNLPRQAPSRVEARQSWSQGHASLLFRFTF